MRLFTSIIRTITWTWTLEKTVCFLLFSKLVLSTLFCRLNSWNRKLLCLLSVVAYKTNLSSLQLSMFVWNFNFLTIFSANITAFCFILHNSFLQYLCLTFFVDLLKHHPKLFYLFSLTQCATTVHIMVIWWWWTTSYLPQFRVSVIQQQGRHRWYVSRTRLEVCVSCSHHGKQINDSNWNFLTVLCDQITNSLQQPIEIIVVLRMKTAVENLVLLQNTKQFAGNITTTELLHFLKPNGFLLLVYHIDSWNMVFVCFMNNRI